VEEENVDIEMVERGVILDTIKLIRYANEGFVNHEQPHIRSNRIKVEGCYAFILKEEDSLLEYRADYIKEHDVINRTEHMKHQLIVPAETMVFVRNKKIAVNKEDIFFNPDMDFVVIPEEAIEKETLIAGERFPLSMDIYVKVPLSFAKKQLDTLHSHYEWIKERVPNPDKVSINTKVIDYCECIINTNDINKGI
jgi:hypothetical protein